MTKTRAGAAGAAIRLLLCALGLLVLSGWASAGMTGERVFGSGFEAPQPIDDAVRFPAPDEVLDADARPAIGVSVPGATLPGTSWQLFVNGIDRTSEATVSDAGIRWTPPVPLPEGLHPVEVRSGGHFRAWSFRTMTPPTFGSFAPVDDIVAGETRPEVRTTFSDVGAGIDPDSLRIIVDGTDVTTAAQWTSDAVSWRPGTDLAEGLHTVRVVVGDLAGHVSTADWSFLIGPEPHAAFVSPGAATLPAGSRPEVRAAFSIASGAIDIGQVVLLVDDVDVTAAATLTMESPQAGAISFVPEAPLAPGEHQAVVLVQSASGIGTVATRQFVVLAPQTGTLEVVSPADGDTVLDPVVRVIVRAVSSTGQPRAVTVDGIPAIAIGPPDAGRFQADVPLSPGIQTLVATAAFVDGTVVERPLTLTLAPMPAVRITEPADLAILGPVAGPDPVPPGGARDLTGAVQRPVRVTGTLAGEIVSVQINQQSADIHADGLGFTFANLFLHEGTNQLGVVATDRHGRTVSDQITVHVDQTAPILTIESPVDGSLTSAARIDVRGMVNDAVEGRIGASLPVVEVHNAGNGATATATATVSNLGFLAIDVPLVVGRNRLEVRAIDGLGNQRIQSLDVMRILGGAARLAPTSTIRHVAPIRSELPHPLSVVALDASGNPMPGVPVRFDVVRGGGSLRAPGQPEHPDGVSPARNLTVPTDAEGQASVWLRLGEDARAGSDRVQATSPGIPEAVTFVASATAAPARRIGIYGSAGLQYVQSGATPIEPLTVQVLDEAANPVADARVRFRIADGDASFEATSAPDGQVAPDGRAIETRTDRQGLAAARPRIGSREGTLTIRAELLDATGGTTSGTTLLLESRAPGASATRLSGVVMDHDGTPIAQVQVSLGRTPWVVQTDANGFFQFEDQVPAGKVDLHLDGRAIQFMRGGIAHQYPALHFETSVVAGRDNQLPHPIYLPPVAIGRSVIVGGSNDVVLTVPGFDGFEMRVRAGSVTFPDGSREGPLVVTAVHADRLPMVPLGTAGQFAGIAWTIQPTNTRFDPPIEVTLPNTTGLSPGRIVPILQWDHDLAMFVPMGQGTVDETGAFIRSDPGTGVTKAGWGGGGPPPPPDNTGCGNAPQCTDCEEPGTDANGCPICVPRTPDGRGSANMCLQPKCRFDRIEGACVAAFGESADFEAILPVELPDDPPNAPDEIRWSTGQRGTPQNASGPLFATVFQPTSGTAAFTETVAAMCEGKQETRQEKSVDVARPCGDYEPVNLVLEEDATLLASTSELGRVTNQWYRAVFRACVANDRWQHRFGEAKLKYDTDYDFGSRTLLTDPEDPDITGDNCRAVLRDLTPRAAAYGTRIAPYNRYLPVPVIERHEGFHHEDYRNRVAQPLVQWMDTTGRNHPTSECKVDNPYEELVEDWDDQKDTLFRAYKSGDGHEQRAYAVENAMLETWRAAIRARAAREGWEEEDCL